MPYLHEICTIIKLSQLWPFNLYKAIYLRHEANLGCNQWVRVAKFDNILEPDMINPFINRLWVEVKLV